MKIIYTLSLIICLSFGAMSQPIIGFTKYITGLTSPVDVVNAGDGSNRLFIVQQNGIIKIANGNVVNATPFLDVSTLITNNGERGLLSMAFHPDYTTNGYFYLYYTNKQGTVGAGDMEIARFKVNAIDPNIADLSSHVTLLNIPEPYSNHNGGRLQFTSNGDLYVGTGDGGSGGDPQNHAQDLNSYLGKLLRINVNNFTTVPYYTVPVDNPYVGVANTKPEIFAFGLRNPFRWSLDRVTGDFWIADVGQGAWEEVDVTTPVNTKGANFGWRCYEGTHGFDLSQCGTTPAIGKTNPVFEYDHSSTGGQSITGGEIYHGSIAGLQNWYIFSDYISTNGWVMKSNGAGGYTVATQNNFPHHFVAYGHAEDGTLYGVNLDGYISTVILAGVLPVHLLSFTGSIQNNADHLNWTIAGTDQNLQTFAVEFSTDGTRFFNKGSVSASATRSDYSFKASATDPVRYYRLALHYADGRITYSDVLKLQSSGLESITLTALSHNQLRLISSVEIKEAILYSADGKALREYKNLVTGSNLISTPTLQSGIYLVRCIQVDGKQFTLKVIVQ